ncbi:hypothetical protein V1511DRAFT_88543 [Dipodascopsis uninucleata]
MSSVFRDLFVQSRISVIAGSPNDDTKSLVAMHVLATFLVFNSSTTCIWIDTTGSFQVYLFREILFQYVKDINSLTGSFSNEQLLQKLIDNVMLIRAFDSIGLSDILNDLDPSHLEFRNREKLSKGSILIVDSFTFIYSKAMRDDQASGHLAMTSFLKNLRMLSNANDLTTILINSTVNANENDLMRSQFDNILQKPSLGLAFLHYCDFCTLISHPDDKYYYLEIIADRWDSTEGFILKFQSRNGKLYFNED